MKSSNLRLAHKLAKDMLPEPEPDMTGWTRMERFMWREKQVGLAQLQKEAWAESGGAPTPKKVREAEYARDEAIRAAREANEAAERLARHPGSAAAQINACATRETAERLAKSAEEAERVAEEAKLRPPPPDDAPEASAGGAEDAAEPAAVVDAPSSPASPEPSPPPEPKPEPQWWEEKAQWRLRGPGDCYEDDTVNECEHEYDPLAYDDDEDPDEVVEY